MRCPLLSAGARGDLCSNALITRHAILKDNLTLRGYDLIFRSQQPGTGAHRCISAKNAPDLFLMGLLSAADALLDRPMKDIPCGAVAGSRNLWGFQRV